MDGVCCWLLTGDFVHRTHDSSTPAAAFETLGFLAQVSLFVFILCLYQVKQLDERRFFPRGQNGQDVDLTIHLHLLSRLKMRGFIPPLERQF